VKSVKCVKKLFLTCLFIFKKLYIINKEDIIVSIIFFKCKDIFISRAFIKSFKNLSAETYLLFYPD